MFLAVSNFIRNRLIEHGFDQDKVITHHLGIPIPALPAIVKDPLSIVTAGRLVEKKGTEYLIRAMRIVVDSIPEAQLTICGDGPLRASLEQLVDSMNLKSNIKFVGWKPKPDVLDILSRASVFVLPSITSRDGDSEGLGMVFLEAMALQTPVIGTNHGGIPDAVQHEVNGYLVKECDPGEIAERIINLIKNPAIAAKMGQQGRNIVETCFDITKQINKLENIYSQHM